MYGTPPPHPLADRPIVAHDPTIITSYDLLPIFRIVRRYGFQGLASAFADLASRQLDTISPEPCPRQLCLIELLTDLAAAAQEAHRSAFVQINPEIGALSAVLRQGEGSAIEDTIPSEG